MVQSFDAIVVVGGGFAGLTAARDLSKAGRSVLLLEARDRLGERTIYRKFTATGKDLEFGGTPVNTGADVRFTPALQGSHRGLAEEKQAGAATKIWILVRNLTENFYGVGNQTTLKFLATEYQTDEGQYLVAFSTAQAGLDPNDHDAVTAAVREFVPDADVVAVEAHDWNEDEFSQGTWMAYRPGQVFDHAVDVQEPHGRVTFAGSDIASGWAGWIDGATESGQRAARTVDEWLS